MRGNWSSTISSASAPSSLSCQASRSPALHRAEAVANGLVLSYDLFDLDGIAGHAAALPRLLDEAAAEDYAGLNITHPCKQRVLDHLDELSGDAEALGAVNTVLFRDGRRIGHNTDWWGFAESMRRGLPGVALHRVLLLGAGGAGVAVAHALMTLGTERLAVCDIDRGRADRLVRGLLARFPDRTITIADRDAVAAADGIVHATPTGMVEHPGLPLDPERLGPRQWLAEIVYFPLETALLHAARQRGLRTLDGGGMAVFQAAGAFRLFTGIAPDAERMLRHFRSMG